MRTYEEIQAGINQALSINDVDALQSLAEEMTSLGTPRAKASAENTLGVLCATTGNYPQAMEHYQRALAEYEQQGDRASAAQVRGNMGTLHMNTGDYPQALEQYRQALAVHEDMGDRAGVASVAGNMGIVYMHTGHYPQALEYHRQALAVHEELGNRASAAVVTGNMGSIYMYTGYYPQAFEYFRQALAAHEELGNRAGAAVATGNMGSVYMNTGYYPQALEHYRQALAMHEEQGSRALAATIAGNIGSVYASAGDYSQALEQYRLALVAHEALGNRAGAAAATGNMGSVYKDSADYPQAFEHFRIALMMFEELGDRAAAALFAGNAVATLLEMNRDEEAEELLQKQSFMQMADPSTRAGYLANKALVAERATDLETAWNLLLEALDVVTAAGSRAAVALYHQKLRDLAKKRNDFEGYVEHNDAYQRITEEVKGKEATQRMAMMEAERKMEAERREREKERALLYGALPESIATRMLRGEDVSGDHFETAAVLFTDIVGFTSNSSSMHPSETIKLLEKLFQDFDAICAEHEVTKVKTIGDSYMCFSEHPQHMAHVAQKMVRLQHTWPNGDRIQIRVGIHAGPVSAGVIGTQRLQYDVWGDTVNVASRMESTGEPGRIHVSEAFMNALVPGTWHLVLRGDTAVKGKGTMKTYWLEAA